MTLSNGIPHGFIVGKFISETKNRFRCVVEVNGTEELCYIASSCRLDNFIVLTDKMVLLMPVTNKNAAAKYSVCGIQHKRSIILLNTAMANQAVNNSFYSRSLAFLGKRHDKKREQTINGYKTDFFIPSTKTLVEVKSIITKDNNAIFPTVYSERLLRQLYTIEMLLRDGYKAHLMLVSLNPYMKQITLCPDNQIKTALSESMAQGLQIEAFTSKLLADGKAYLGQRIPVLL